jgi:hypothetical protein
MGVPDQRPSENNGNVAAGEYNSVGMAQTGNGLSRARLTVRGSLSLSEPKSFTGEYKRRRDRNENDDGRRGREGGEERREGDRVIAEERKAVWWWKGER